MSYIGKNIKKIRVVKKMSQTDFANIFDISRTSVGAYEDGRAEPKIETIIQIASHFKLSIDTLLTKELTVNELFKFNIFTENLKKEEEALTITNKDELDHQTPLVTLDKSLDYIVNYNNHDFVNRLPVISFPFIKTKRSRAFQVDGGEMEYENSGLHHKDILLCKPIADLEKMEAGKVYALVTEKEIIIKRFEKFEKQYLFFSPDNPTYDQLKVKSKDLIEVWEAVSVFSNKLKMPSRLEQRLSTLEDAFQKLKEQLNKKV